MQLHLFCNLERYFIFRSVRNFLSNFEYKSSYFRKNYSNLSMFDSFNLQWTNQENFKLFNIIIADFYVSSRM